MSGEKSSGGGAYSRGRGKSMEGLGVARGQMREEVGKLQEEKNEAGREKIKMMKGLLIELAAEYQDKELSMEEFFALMRSMKLIIDEYSGGYEKPGEVKQNAMQDVGVYFFTVEKKPVTVNLYHVGPDRFVLFGLTRDAELGRKLMTFFTELSEK